MACYIIYRDKTSNKITKYSKLKVEKPDLEKIIELYNSNHDNKAEKVISDDIKCLIEIAEAHKILKQDDIKSIEYAIEYAFDNLQSELYSLQERFNL